MDHDGRLDVLDVHKHRDQGDDEDGAWGQVNGDHIVSNLSSEGHDKESPPVNFSSGDICDRKLRQFRMSRVNEELRNQFNLLPVNWQKFNRRVLLNLNEVGTFSSIVHSWLSKG